MSKEFPIIYVARPGETTWTFTGQHTGLTDLHLTENGERVARFKGPTFAKVFRLQRARRTCKLAGFGAGRFLLMCHFTRRVDPCVVRFPLFYNW